MDFQAIVRRARRFDRLQADEAADAVIDVDDEIARRQRRRLGQHVLGAPPALARMRTRRSPRMSCSPMTARSSASKPLLERDHRQRQRAGARRSRPAATTRPAPGASGRARRAHGRGARASRRSSRRRRPSGRDRSSRGCGATAASNTLRFSSSRSGAKSRPTRPPQSNASARVGGASNGVSRASGPAASRAATFVRAQIEPVGRQRPIVGVGGDPRCNAERRAA